MATFNEWFSNIRNDIFQFTNGQVDASIPNTFENAMSATVAAFQQGIYNTNTNFFKQFFLATVTDPSYVLLWAAQVGLSQKLATVASGYIDFIGVSDTVIPAGTQLQNTANNIIYTTLANGTIQNNSIGIASIQRIANVVTVTTTVPHTLANNVLVTISGVSPSDLNITNTTIAVISTTTFTYSSNGSDETGSGGSMLVSFTNANILVQSNTASSSANLQSSSTMSLLSPITGINSIAVVDAGGVLGGSDNESIIPSLLNRIIQKIQNPGVLWSVNNINSLLLQNTVATRAWTYQALDENEAGYVTTVSVDDNQTPITLNSTELADQLAYLQSIAPASLPLSAITCLTINPINNDVTITGLLPATTVMYQAVKQQLLNFYQTKSQIKRYLLPNVITEVTIESQVLQTVDSSGQSPTFASLAANILSLSEDNDLPILGTLTINGIII